MPEDIYSAEPSPFPHTMSAPGNSHAARFRHTMTTTIDNGRESAVHGLRRTASALRDTNALHGTPTLGKMAHDTAERLDAAAQYLDAHTCERLMGDAREVVTRNPGRSLAVAAALGFVVAVALKRNRY
jgi:ElaB/YqjD/DUF883 family membrane-anchored ribosome-binding protein